MKATNYAEGSEHLAVRTNELRGKVLSPPWLVTTP